MLPNVGVTSREDLVRSIVQPLIEEGEQFIAKHERARDATARELLEGYFDYHFAHRRGLVLVVAELTTVIACGGLQDCCLQFPGTPYAKLRRATVDGALAALGVDQSSSG